MKVELLSKKNEGRLPKWARRLRNDARFTSLLSELSRKPDRNGKFNGMLLYSFLVNEPIASVDFLGLNTEMPWTCAERIRNEEIGRPSIRIDDPYGRVMHCTASCRVASECIGGGFAAWVGGDWVQDPWWKPYGGGGAGSDPYDRDANRHGRNLDPNKPTCKCPHGGCDCLCNEAAENGDIPLGLYEEGISSDSDPDEIPIEIQNE